MAWKRINRKIVYKTKYLTLYEDTVELESGETIDDYSVVSVPNSVVIVATTPDDKLIALMEYKYASNRNILTLPAGSIDDNDIDVVAAARRELEEETGYNSEEAILVDTLDEYPSKFNHTISVVRIKNAVLTTKPLHEVTESIDSILLLDKDFYRQQYRFTSTAMIAALVKTLPQFL